MTILVRPEAFGKSTEAFAKSRDNARINRAFKIYAQFLRTQFKLMVRHATAKPVLEAVKPMLAAANFEGALDLLTPFIDRFSNALGQVHMAAARAETELWAKRLKVHKPKLKKAGQQEWVGEVTVSFDPTDPRIVEAMRRNRLAYIQEFTRQQRSATRAALVQGMREGLGPEALARLFSHTIGLTSHQWQYVMNYQAALERGSRAALEYALRDRRFDPTVERIIDENDVLSAEQIERMVGAYTENLIDLRAETIARTETLGILEEAREDGLRQAIEQAGIESDWVAKEWSTTLDGRQRDTHDEMNGQLRELDEPFDSPSGEQLDFPGDPKASAGEIINCRCTVLHHVFSSREELEEFLNAA